MSITSAASVVSGGLAGYPTVYYDRVAVSTVRSNLFLYPALDLKQMPDKSGVAMQIFNYTAFVANTTPATEGTLESGQVLTQNVRTLSLSQFVDYVSYSDKVVMTAISDTVAEGAVELGYRGALTVDTIISTTVDSAANTDSATRIEITDGSYMTASISRKAAYGLRSKDIKPKSNGLFYGVIPAVMAFDLVNDATAGGFIDLTKYTEANASKNFDGVANNRIGVVGGVEWFESNALPTETNWQSSAHAGYHAYVFGKDAFFGSSLGTTKLGDKNFSVKTSRFNQPIAVDPANVIAAASSYNFFFGVAKTPGSINRFRRIRSESSIG